MAAARWCIIQIECVLNSYREDRLHQFQSHLQVEPGRLAALGRRSGLPVKSVTPVDQSDHALAQILVDAGEPHHLDLNAGLFQNLADDAVFELLFTLEHPARSLPLAVVAPPDEKNPATGVDGYTSD